MPVSVVIPAYNAAEYLREALNSVLAQTCKPAEIIVVDDGSTDHTKDVCLSFGADVKYIYQSNDGTYGATANFRGVSESSGDLVAFLDQDDRWLPTKLEKQVALLEATSNAGAAFTTIRNMDESGVPGDELPAPPSGDVFHALLEGCPFIRSSALIRREALNKIEFGDLSLACGDWDQLLRLARNYHFAVVNEPLTERRVHGDNFSRDRTRLAAGVRQIMDLNKLRLHPDCEECQRSLRIGSQIPDTIMADVARKHLDNFHDCTQKRQYSEARSYLWKAMRTSPKEVFKPKRLAAVVKNGLRAIIL